MNSHRDVLLITTSALALGGLLATSVPFIQALNPSERTEQIHGLAREFAHAQFRVGLPIFMLLGIRLLGSFAMAIGMVPTGGKFFEPEQNSSFLALWTMFPIATFTMSTYSGSLGGVGLVTPFPLLAEAISGARGRASNITVERDALPQGSLRRSR